MKKRFLLGVAVIVAILLVALGPTVLDLLRLQHYIDTWGPAAEADAGAWPRLPDVCAGCHGNQGNSQNQGYPSLAGQPDAYLANQLRNFAEGRRENPNMAPLAQTLSEAEVKLVSEYYARQPAAANLNFESDAASREKGRQLVSDRGCAACHGGNLMGRGIFPRLAGQGYDYLLAQLDAFAAGTRSEPTGAMKNFAVAMSADERKAIAAFLATLKPEPAGPNAAGN